MKLNNIVIFDKPLVMKKVCLFVVMLISLTCFGQIGTPFPNKQFRGSPTTLDTVSGPVISGTGFIIKSYADTISANNNLYLKHYPGAMIFTTGDNSLKIRNSTATKWDDYSLGGGLLFNGNRPITRDFSTITGVTPGGTTVPSFLENVFYPSQNPTSALTGTYLSTSSAFNLELMAAGAPLNMTLSWGAGRQASTAALSTVNVDGVNQSFSQPSAPGTATGTKATTFSRNVNTFFTNLVTTSDGKTALSTVTINWFPKRYWFYSTVSPPASSDIVTALGGGSELTTSKDKSTFSVVVSGSTKYVSYAYPSSYGLLTSIIVSGLESIGAFTQTTVSVTNASGNVQNYYVYTTINTFSSTTIQFNSVQ